MFSEIRGSVKSLTFKRHGKGAVACARPLVPYSESADQKKLRGSFRNTSTIWKLMPAGARWFSRSHDDRFSSDRNYFFEYNISSDPLQASHRLLAPRDKSVPVMSGKSYTTSGVPGEIIFHYDILTDPSRFDFWFMTTSAGLWYVAPYNSGADLSLRATSFISPFTNRNQRFIIALIDLETEHARHVYANWVTPA